MALTGKPNSTLDYVSPSDYETLQAAQNSNRVSGKLGERQTPRPADDQPKVVNGDSQQRAFVTSALGPVLEAWFQCLRIDLMAAVVFRPRKGGHCQFHW